MTLIKPRSITKKTNVLVLNDYNSHFSINFQKAGYWTLESSVNIVGTESSDFEKPINYVYMSYDKLLELRFIDLIVLIIPKWNRGDNELEDFKKILELPQNIKVAIFSDYNLQEKLPFFNKENQYLRPYKYGIKMHSINTYAYYIGLPNLISTTPNAKKDKYDRNFMSSWLGELGEACVTQWDPILG